MSEESVINQAILVRTINMREKLLNKIIDNDKINNEDREFAVKLLDGLDRSTLSFMKIKSDEKMSDNQQTAAKNIVADILSNLTIKKQSSSDIRELTLSDEHIIHDVVKGEAFIGIEEISYNEIIKEV